MGTVLKVVLIVLIILVVGYFISTYNKLIKERLKVDNQWSQIDIVLKQRNDTIPNLMNAVSGYASYEKDLFYEITEARKRYGNAKDIDQSVQAAADLSKCIDRLFAIAENHPEIKANTNFMDLQNQISFLEAKIADFRQFYNDTVMRYNRLVFTFPSNLIAKVTGFKERKFFHVEEKDKSVPEVNFNN